MATGEFLYNRDVNGIYYINANLPAAQSAFAGVDNRPRWTGVACAAAGKVGAVRHADQQRARQSGDRAPTS